MSPIILDPQEGTSGDLTTPVAQVRLEIGDTTEPLLFADEEITYKLSTRDNNVLHTAADLCTILATRYAHEFDFETDGQRFNRSQKSKAFRELADTLRKRALVAGGLAVMTTTRTDRYSDDLSTRDGAAGGTDTTGRARHGFYDNDTPA